MKKIFSIICLVLGIAACTDEQVGPQTPSTNEAQTALELVNSFRANIQGQSRSNSLTDLTILDVSKEAISFKKKGTSPQSRSQEDDCIQDVEIYTFTFENNGQKGFAISVPDERINQVLAYCENGSIADTAYIEGFSRVINNIPYTCAEILNNYYTDTTQSRATTSKIITFDNFVKTAWHQKQPYNDACPVMGCGGTNRALAGCAAVATAQAIAYLGYHPKGYNLKALSQESNINVWDPLASEVAQFMYDVALGCKTKFGCTESTSNTGNIRDYLTSIGYNQPNTPSFEYNKSSSFDKGKLYNSLLYYAPVLAAGNMKKGGGHAWLYTGMQIQVNMNDGKIEKLIALYCNWGVNGNCNGWYTESQGFNQPRDQATLEPLTSKPYNNSNSYIYFSKKALSSK